jgi:hypothetical protein
MKRLLFFAGLLAIITGCSNTTSSINTRVSPTSGEVLRDKVLTLSANEEQTIERGKTDEVDIGITRSNFDEPVTIEVGTLPKGITVVGKEMTIPNNAKKLTLTLQASADAAVGKHDVMITASAPGIQKTSQSFKLNVK